MHCHRGSILAVLVGVVRSDLVLADGCRPLASASLVSVSVGKRATQTVPPRAQPGRQGPNGARRNHD